MSHSLPSGDEFRELLGESDVFAWRYGHPFFTAAELSKMYRAQQGDYTWMYDKNGNPRAGWVRLWNDWDKAQFIRDQKDKARRKQKKAEKRAKKEQFAKRHPTITFLIFFLIIAGVIAGAVVDYLG